MGGGVWLHPGSARHKPQDNVGSSSGITPYWEKEEELNKTKARDHQEVSRHSGGRPPQPEDHRQLTAGLPELALPVSTSLVLNSIAPQDTRENQLDSKEKLQPNRMGIPETLQELSVKGNPGSLPISTQNTAASPALL